MAIYGHGGANNYMAIGYGNRTQNNPFGTSGMGFPMASMASPFGLGGGGNPMQQMMQTMMGMLMGMMAGQMLQQIMQQGGGQPFGQFPPGMNPGFGGGGVPNMGGGGGGNGMGNFLGCGCNGAARGNGGAQGPGNGHNGPQGPNTMTPPSSTGQISALSQNKDERIRQVVDAAKRTYPDKPHMAKLAAAQALLESGIASERGPSGLARNHNNLFGIKGSGTAGSANMRTGEHFNGRDVTINANFAKNNTVEDSFQQHKNLMSKPRYRKVLQAQSFEQAAQEVKAAGYATSPSYTGSLVSVYNTHLARHF